MNLEQISIIIPVYNVEKYLPECIESVLHQTYKNLQIILVDDGSSDSCSAICDEYAQKYGFIIAIHKENSGLSDARNTGLCYATGEFVYYLDSDDYIEQNTIELLVECQERTQADVVFGNYYYTFPDYETIADTFYQEETILNNYEAMAALVNGKIQTFAWGKLIRTEIAEKYLFPKGKLFEDHYWTHFAFGDAKRVAIISQPLVHYRQRNNSISYTFNLRRLDVLEGWLNRKVFLEEKYPELVDVCMKQYAERYVEVAWLVLTRMKQKRRAFQKLRKINILLQLQNYSEGKTKQLICSLDKSSIVYAVQALWNRLRRRK